MAEWTRGNEPWEGEETGVTQGWGRERGHREGTAQHHYLAGDDLTGGGARKSQRKMASPTLMTCCWSGVKATWRTGSEWPMNTWERACLESPTTTCPLRMGLLHSLPCTGRRSADGPEEDLSHLQCSHYGLINAGLTSSTLIWGRKQKLKSPKSYPASEALGEPFSCPYGPVPNTELSPTSVLCRGSHWGALAAPACACCWALLQCGNRAVFLCWANWEWGHWAKSHRAHLLLSSPGIQQ